MTYTSGCFNYLKQTLENVRKEKCVLVLLGRPDEKISLGISGRIILKCNLERWNWRA